MNVNDIYKIKSKCFRNKEQEKSHTIRERGKTSGMKEGKVGTRGEKEYSVKRRNAVTIFANMSDFAILGRKNKSAREEVTEGKKEKEKFSGEKKQGCGYKSNRAGKWNQFYFNS